MEKGDLKRILIGFFVIMLLLTVLSRAAASITVPRVTAQSVKEGILTYQIYGTGIVEKQKTRSVPVMSGLIVEEIFAESGKQVKEGEALFSYTMESIEEALEKKENEWRKLELSYEQEKIGALGEGDAADGAKLSMEQADEALKQAKTDLKDGKKQIKEEAEEQLKTLKKEVKEKLEAIEQEAKEQLEALEKEYEALSNSWEEKKLQAEWETEDAQTAYEEQKQTKDKVESLLKAYGQDIEKEDSIEKRNKRQELITLYYGSEYQNYQNRKSRAIKAVINASEDIENIKAKWKNLIREEDKYSDDKNVVDNYKNQCEERDSEIKTAEQVMESARVDLLETMEEENVLIEAMDQYEKGEVGSYQKLYGLFVEKLAIDESAIAKAKKSWERAIEIQRRLETQAEKELSELLKKKDKFKEKVAAIQEGTYDYGMNLQEKTEAEEELLELLEKKNDAEEKAAAIQEETYDYEKDLQERKQAVKSAEYALEQAKHNVKSAKNSTRQAEESRRLRQEALIIDMEEKQQELEVLQKLKKNRGNVMAVADGTVAEQQLEPGAATTGQERILLAADMYCFQAEVEAEVCQHFQVGDQIVLSKDGVSETFAISGISTEEKDGKRSITVELPEEGYPLGSSWSFQAEKKSVSFNQKIPIQCLRKDNSGYYVLIVSERDGILGTEQYLSRIGVEFLQKDDSYAAIRGSLGREDKIVVSGSRNVENGDRVRLVEE